MSENAKIEKKKVAITEQTYISLKTFSRLNGLKLRTLIDSMTEVMLGDETLSQRLIDLSLEKESGNTE